VPPSSRKIIESNFVRDYPPENLPYTHRLLKIAESSAVLNKLELSQKKFLADIDSLNIETRYPEEIDKISSLLTKEYCENLIERTEGFIKWLKEN
jgi:HEPN domain-containing protein